MIVEKVKSRKYKNTQYYKYRVILPQDIIESSTSQPGDELTATAKKGEKKLTKLKKK